jgi:hypothetical protein
VQLRPILTQNASSTLNALLTVTDPDTSPANLAYTGTSTNTSLVSGITFYFDGTNEVAVINPVPNESGSSLITISVSDGFSSDSKSFVLMVIQDTFPFPPMLKANANGNQVIFQLTGTAKALYDLQTSTDLKVWTSTQTVTANVAGVLFFTNTISPTVRLQFLRAIVR